MEWFYKDTIQAVISTPGKMEGGIYRNGEETTKSISCDVQPSGLSRTNASYGVYLTSDYTVFCDPDSDLKKGMKVIYKSKRYEIIKLVDWDDYYILYIEAVGL